MKPFTTDEVAARTLLPPEFEWLAITPTAGWIYAPYCRAGIGDDGLPFPHHGQWSQTIPLSLCGGVQRALGDAGTVNPSDDPSLVTFA